MQWLVFTHGPFAGRRVQVQGDETTIGRRQTNDIVLKDPMVSRLHAILVRKHGAVMVEDLGSQNGTYVNNERVMFIRPLQHGDIVQIGASRIFFEDASLDVSDATVVQQQVAVVPHAFTERQMQVLRLAARGLANKEIAKRLSVSERTVKAYLTSVFDKLGVTNRSAAIMTALRLGLIEMPSPEEK